MPLDPDYLTYPMRRKGMDHDLYDAANLFDAPKVSWPNGKPLAVSITVALEYFPLTPNDGPFRAPGHMVTPFPDYRTFTTRDYGHRVALYRLMDAFAAHDIKVTAFTSSALIDRRRAVIDHIREAGWEIAALGTDMNAIHHGGMDEATERAQIETCLDQWSSIGVTPKGWMSPGRGQSAQTIALLKEAGLEWTADWGNDDMPFTMKNGLIAMPYTDELEDRKCLTALGQREEVWMEQILGAADWLSAEAQSSGGRILHVALTPYIIGQPFRIAFLRDLLAQLARRDDVWFAQLGELCTLWSQAMATASAPG